MSEPEFNHVETAAIHAWHTPDPATGALVPPISLATTFERAADGDYPLGFEYARDNNPNRAMLETALAVLEGGEAALTFSSGLGAAMSVLQALGSGQHVIAPQDVYWGVQVLLREVFGAGWGLQVSFVDMTQPDEVKAALRPETKLVIIETPSNPMILISDIAAIAALAHEVGAQLLVDNTIGTPILQQPLKLGADLVMHATTKYIAGHSDVLGGAVIAREAANPLFERIRLVQKYGGAVPSPFECWLALRGIQTLPLRVRAMSESAARIAAFLQAHPAVERVHYPGLSDHPGAEVAARQMTNGGALMSVQVRGGQAEAMEVAARVKVFTRATSFGGVHSLVEHRASIEAPGTRTPANLLRLSVGLEHVDDLIADLEQALAFLVTA